MLVSTAPTIAAEEHPEQPFATVDLTVIEQFPGAIEAFVKAGDPNGENIPHWPPMMVDGKQLMESWKVCGIVLVPARGC
ncbi:hypothetical protein ACSV9I_16025 [Rhizobium sp. G187]|uniref:hypothetical protein n=1 Tax=Rhizobium sp. G187 TaxID=3451352 RepID=UPI003EE5B6AA